MNPLVHGEVCNMLKPYLDLCNIYFVEYEQKQVLIIEVLKADSTLSLDGKIYYRDGETEKCSLMRNYSSRKSFQKGSDTHHV